VRLLLDAHAVLWWLSDDPALAEEARERIADPSNEILVSAATVWEIGIKRASGKLEAPTGLARAIAEEGFSELPVTAQDAERAADLPGHHRDPFDRMLVAQVMRTGAVLVTHDRAFAVYGVPTLPA
jgi:PIN domain nuclease of toxin-antitoxin system